MMAIKTFIARHRVPTYFALTFAISWGGVLLVIGGPGGIPGTTEQTETLFPFAYLAMLAGPGDAHARESHSQHADPHASNDGVPLVTYDLVLAAALWVVVAAVAVAKGGQLSRRPLRRRVA